MPLGATPSRWCVCQFHHFRTENRPSALFVIVPASTILLQNPASFLCLQNSSVELRHFRVQRDRLQRQHQRLACLCRIKNGVNPEARRSIAAIGLFFVRGLNRSQQVLLLLLAQLLAFALKLAQLEDRKST